MKKFSVKIMRVPFLIPTWVVAQVPMPRVIFVRRNYKLTRAVLAHELCHVMQWEEYGLAFAFRYLLSLLGGYENSVYERAARSATRNPFYLTWADEILEGGT